MKIVMGEDNVIVEMKKGNQEALDYVIEEYGWLLKSVLKKHLFYFPDAIDECMNDCLLAIWENVDYFDPERSTFKNWIGAIAKYKSIDYARKELRRKKFEVTLDSSLSNENTPLEAVLSEELSEEMEKLLSTLKKEDREIFLRRYVQEEEVSEIGECLGLSASVIYNRLSRTRKKLRMYSSKGKES